MDRIGHIGIARRFKHSYDVCLVRAPEIADDGHFVELASNSCDSLSWGIALFEYCFMIPANRIGYVENGGPFSLLELKVLQEVITLMVFSVFVTVFFKGETLHWNHLVSFALLILAVYFAFMKVN